MSVHVLETPFELPKLDMDIVIASRSRLARLAESLNTVHLPIKQEKLLSLMQELSHADRQALKVLTVSPQTLDSHGLPQLLAGLPMLKTQPLTEETGRLIDELVKEIRAQRIRVLDEIQVEARALDNALTNFAAVHVSDVAHLLEQAEAAVAQSRTQIEADNEPLAKLVELEGAVNTLIEQVESLSLFDRLKPLVESLDKLAEIDPQQPLAGTIKAGIAGISNMLGIANEALKYRDLIDLRKSLQQQRDELTTRSRELYDHFKEVERKRDELLRLQSIAEPQSTYAQELGKLNKALQRFLDANRMQGFDDVEAATERFIGHARILADYLDALRRDWRS